MAPIPRPPNPNLRSTTPAIDRPAHVLIATILFIERRRWGRPRNAILREHPRHDWEHALGQAAENHGGLPLPPPPETPDVVPAVDREIPPRREHGRRHRAGVADVDRAGATPA